MNAKRTIIVALAIELDSAKSGTSLPAFENFIPHEVSEKAHIVGMLDKDRPENNFRPEVFSEFHTNRQRAGDRDNRGRDHGFGIEPGFSGFEHAP